MANRFSSRPDKERIFAALSALYESILTHPGKYGPLVHLESIGQQKIIILSDQHKGAKDDADDFAFAEKNYLAALDYYFQQHYYYINLGDSEELWENSLQQVKKHNKASFAKERLFLEQKRFSKIFGNHDLYWGNDPFASLQLESIYQQKIPIYEGAVIETNINSKTLRIFLTHGHQGDLQSDGNWFSKWFVAMVWAPLQGYLRLNPNTPAYDIELKTEHNKLMYEWSSEQQQLLLITGHTHQTVFESLTHLERLYKALSIARQSGDATAIQAIESTITVRLKEGDALPDFTAVKPGYFNSGCCCFNDGDITGIEIADGMIRLIKWEYEQDQSVRKILEEESLEKLVDLIGE